MLGVWKIFFNVCKLMKFQKFKISQKKKKQTRTLDLDMTVVVPVYLGKPVCIWNVMHIISRDLMKNMSILPKFVPVPGQSICNHLLLCFLCS